MSVTAAVSYGFLFLLNNWYIFLEHLHALWKQYAYLTCYSKCKTESALPSIYQAKHNGTLVFTLIWVMACIVWSWVWDLSSFESADDAERYPMPCSLRSHYFQNWFELYKFVFEKRLHSYLLCFPHFPSPLLCFKWLRSCFVQIILIQTKT